MNSGRPRPSGSQNIESFIRAKRGQKITIRRTQGCYYYYHVDDVDTTTITTPPATIAANNVRRSVHTFVTDIKAPGPSRAAPCELFSSCPRYF